MKKGKDLLRLVGLVVCFFALSVQAQGAVSMPAFSLPTAVDGAVVTSDAYRGKAMLVTFFATWCPPCLQEIPALKELQTKFDPQGFAVVALSVDEGGSGPVALLVKRAGINYQVLMADQTTTRNFGGVAAIPTSFLVNKHGQVVKKYPGFVPHGLLERDIESVL
jgi:peroxiredoxin